LLARSHPHTPFLEQKQLQIPLNRQVHRLGRKRSEPLWRERQDSDGAAKSDAKTIGERQPSSNPASVAAVEQGALAVPQQDPEYIGVLWVRGKSVEEGLLLWAEPALEFGARERMSDELLDLIRDLAGLPVNGRRTDGC
jgi:hypothetical protein